MHIESQPVPDGQEAVSRINTNINQQKGDRAYEFVRSAAVHRLFITRLLHHHACGLSGRKRKMMKSGNTHKQIVQRMCELLPPADFEFPFSLRLALKEPATQVPLPAYFAGTPVDAVSQQTTRSSCCYRKVHVLARCACPPLLDCKGIPCGYFASTDVKGMGCFGRCIILLSTNVHWQDWVPICARDTLPDFGSIGMVFRVEKRHLSEPFDS